MPSAATILGSYGLAGLVIAVLSLVVLRQYKDNRALQDKFDLLQGARLQDAKDNLDKFGQPLQSISQTMNMIYDKLQDSKNGAK